MSDLNLFYLYLFYLFVLFVYIIKPFWWTHSILFIFLFFLSFFFFIVLFLSLSLFFLFFSETNKKKTPTQVKSTPETHRINMIDAAYYDRIFGLLQTILVLISWYTNKNNSMINRQKHYQIHSLQKKKLSALCEMLNVNGGLIPINEINAIDNDRINHSYSIKWIVHWIPIMPLQWKYLSRWDNKKKKKKKKIRNPLRPAYYNWLSH